MISAMDTSKELLTKLWAIEDDLTPGKKILFHNSFIGRLSGLVPADLWEKALKAAKESVTVHGSKKD